MSTCHRRVVCVAVLGALSLGASAASAASAPAPARTGGPAVKTQVVKKLNPGAAKLAKDFRIARQEQVEVSEARLEAWSKQTTEREGQDAKDGRCAARHRALAGMVQLKAARTHAWKTFREVRREVRREHVQGLRKARIEGLQEWRDTRKELREDRREARDDRREHRKDNIENRQERREDRRDVRGDLREDRTERREDRRDARSDGREDRKDAREDRHEDRQDTRKDRREDRKGSPGHN